MKWCKIVMNTERKLPKFAANLKMFVKPTTEALEEKENVYGRETCLQLHKCCEENPLRIFIKHLGGMALKSRNQQQLFLYLYSSFTETFSTFFNQRSQSYSFHYQLILRWYHMWVYMISESIRSKINIIPKDDE